MIATLRGQVTELGNRYAVVEIANIGYKVFLTDDSIHSLKVGTETFLSIYNVIREDANDLYGFVSRKERDFFELLISISGIGPKSALNIMSLVSSDTLVSAIRSGSTSHLVKVSGIGRKTAEKIVLELKDKLAPFAVSHDSEYSAEISSDMDAVEALMALGFSADESREALKKIDKSISATGAKVKAALKMLS
ncbi:MAG: Holliday junction branch migration protein RuvA [Patescibacteria group bacterium]